MPFHRSHQGREHDPESSSLNNEDPQRRHHFNANGPSSSAMMQNRRADGRVAQTIAKTACKILLIIALVVLALYVLTHQMLWRSCATERAQFAPLIEKDGILELSWDSLPTAIRTVSNLAIVEHNSQCGHFNVSLLKSLACDHLTLAYMPHSAFAFRSFPVNASCTSTLPTSSAHNGPVDAQNEPTTIHQVTPCYGLRWIANRLDTYYGPFMDLEDLKQWFNSVTSADYVGCLGKPAPQSATNSNDLHGMPPAHSLPTSA